MFRILRREPTSNWDAVITAVDDNDRTCLTVAAGCGHVDLVDLVCQTYSLMTLTEIWDHKIPLNAAV